MREQVEFPYDLGFFTNMSQAMGTSNVLAWFFPFAQGPRVAPEPPTAQGMTGGIDTTGWVYEENGFNRSEGMWPPPDPEKTRRERAGGWPGANASSSAVPRVYGSMAEEKAAFSYRQDQDMRRRWQTQQSGIIAVLEEAGGGGDDYDYALDDDDTYGNMGAYGEVEGLDRDFFEPGQDGEPGWTNHDGERLADFGVDEDAEIDGADLLPISGRGGGAQDHAGVSAQDIGVDDEDVPLGELLRRRKVRNVVGGSVSGDTAASGVKVSGRA